MLKESHIISITKNHCGLGEGYLLVRLSPEQVFCHFTKRTCSVSFQDLLKFLAIDLWSIYFLNTSKRSSSTLRPFFLLDFLNQIHPAMHLKPYFPCSEQRLLFAHYVNKLLSVAFSYIFQHWFLFVA
jgi:hypothetical protein